MGETRRYFDHEYEVTTEGRSSPAYDKAIREVVGFVRPKPMGRPLVRIGPDRDGAYLLPDDFDGIGACFSPGVNNQKDFEDELAVKYKIKSHMCDYTSDEGKLRTPLILGMQTFSKKWLDLPGKEDSIDLDTWVRKAAPDPASELILQIDIEGAEFRNLLTCSDATLRRFRVILIEVHGLNYLRDPSLAINLLHPFFMKLAQQFVCVHAHPNNCCGETMLPELGINLPSLVELTLYRKDRHAQTRQDTEPTVLLPHPDDIERNVPGLAPIVLNEKWLDGPRPPASRIKILEDETAWLRGELGRVERDGELMTTAIRYLAKASTNQSTQPATPSNEERLQEVAEGRPYRLSNSSMTDGIAGIVSEKEPFFFHTAIDANQYIKIDIGSPKAIRRLEIRNRLDMCHDRARMMFALFHVREDWDGAEVQFIDAPDEFLNGRNLDMAVAVPGRAARYVTLFSPIRTALHFSRIRILAEPAPSRA